jgi:peptidoglycan/xylan/chitin deacetylase (PgdA/CDA1 family)
MYHRVAEPEIDPWGLAVSPRNFADQMSVLRRQRRTLAVNDFVRQWNDGSLPPDAVTLTFDDGYLDNLELALPRLEAAEIPATFFLATGYLGDPHPYWWDELAELILLRIGLEVLDMGIGEHGRQVIGKRDPVIVSQLWRMGAGAMTTRQEALPVVWSLLRDMDFAQRADLMSRLRQLGDPVSPQIGRPMTFEEARSAAHSPLITIGAHTITHPSMMALPAERLADEIATSQRVCTEIAGGPITTFAYPFGHEDEAARAAVERAKFEVAFGVEPRPVRPDDARFALPRAQVPNADGDGFELFLATFG